MVAAGADGAVVVRRDERGMALVVVLGIVALVAAWASRAAWDDMVALRRAENGQEMMRARLACLSALALARRVLREDARHSSRDDAGEMWAKPMAALPVDEGVVSGRIEDANRRVNLNDLVDDAGRVRPAVREALMRLFARAGVDASLVDALADWMDADATPNGPGGAEDAAYFDRSWRVKNARLDDWSELALVRGFDAEALRKLAPVVGVWPPPAGALSRVNVNTASADVLRALFPAMSEADVDELRQHRPYDNTAGLVARSWAASGNIGWLGVSSRVFIAHAEARFGRAIAREDDLLLRGADGRLTLLARLPARM